MRVIAITGVTGFIGEHLLNQLVRRKGIELRVLIHEKTNKNIMSRSNIKTIKGVCYFALSSSIPTHFRFHYKNIVIFN